MHLQRNIPVSRAVLRKWNMLRKRVQIACWSGKKTTLYWGRILNAYNFWYDDHDILNCISNRSDHVTIIRLEARAVYLFSKSLYYRSSTCFEVVVKLVMPVAACFTASACIITTKVMIVVTYHFTRSCIHFCYKVTLNFLKFFYRVNFFNFKMILSQDIITVEPKFPIHVVLKR
jgi:hypothetical protein